MKKVGIIDNYISNFHSNTYHRLFHEIAVEEAKEEYVITHIYAKTDKSPSTGETTDEWCQKTGALKCETIKQVCDEADVLMVLSPNNPELHEEFCRIAFESGKPVYVDKTFAPDYETAKRIAQCGKANNASFWSSSATRFEPCVSQFLKADSPSVNSVTVESGYAFEIYSIHLIELMNTFMKNGAKSVICRNNSANKVFEVRYKDGRKAFLNQFEGTYADFCCYPEINNECTQMYCKSDFWKCFCKALLEFFETGKAPVNIENTLECIAVRSALKKSIENPYTEIAVEGAV